MTPTLTRSQAQLAARALMPRVEALRELYEVQVQTLPAGCSDWADTRQEITDLEQAITALHWMGAKP